MTYRLPTIELSRPLAITESITATLIWASSFILAQVGLEQIGPLTIAGLRYSLAGLLLLPFLFRGRQSARYLSRQQWWRLFWIGMTAHAIGNGALFWGLHYLSATTLTFVSCFLPIPVLLLGIVQLKERPTFLQIVGLVITLVGSALFFSPGVSSTQWLGIGIALVGLLSFSYSMVLGRGIARDQQTSTLALTALPLLFGGLPLLSVAIAWEGAPQLSPLTWQVVLALTLFNTILAYMLYNHSMQTLTAFETNVFLNLAPIGTAVLAWYFLGETLSLFQVVGMFIVIGGVTLVQWHPSGAS